MKLKSLHAIWVKYRFTLLRETFEVFVEIKPAVGDTTQALGNYVEKIVQDDFRGTCQSFLEYLAAKLFEKGYHVLQVGLENKVTKIGECVYFLEDKDGVN